MRRRFGSIAALDVTPDQYCEERAARAGSSFYYAFRFLSEERRGAITAFYAFCREADDIVDEVRDPTVAAAKLDFWRREVRAMARGEASHPVTRAMTPHLARFDIPISAFEHVLDGMSQDLAKTRYLDFAELDRYCYLVAGVVGEVSARIFGIPPGHVDQTLAYARALGESLQLINILRDVGEDARRGRLYLPQSLLDEHGVSAAAV
ncbi:MAG: squalene/phytoene synthase family protein, partial [Casimicrobiaceae bacterium]